MTHLPKRVVQNGCAVVFVAVGFAFASVGGISQESNRIKRPPASFDESEALAVEVAKSDGLLRQGDIVVTPRGFLMFKGIAADGYTNEFEPVPNPLNQNRIRKN
ncbi:hypothetical protein [Bradyrhizobium sp. AS23.2]|uniref:hypothetical protein n=1 Tax=Bradyrhizobium sp. AS23.2 TaxID=1680155 RepID=UPI00093B8240|nr:hypothetical protein [Bradyrhizobium sp. AS23.2]OKO86842.1 hypothetical protein AC630_02000 [Bradyrhizobium sp. AS23.2]